jgi:hypothetical protein
VLLRLVVWSLNPRNGTTVQSVSGKELQSVLFGKPHRTTYEYAIRLIAELATQQGHTTPPQRFYAVGDNPLSGTTAQTPTRHRTMALRRGDS